MKKIWIFLALVAMVTVSCRMGKRIRGNGNVRSEVRTVGSTDRVKLSGSYDVEITQGAVASVKVEGDDNILPYVITEERDGFLVIRSRDNVNFSTEHDIKVYITTAKLEAVHISGSGNVKGMNKFTGGDKMDLRISGSGDISMELNSPDLKAEITGSGTITLKGETRDENIHITGAGDFKGEELKAENAKVRITGSGDVKVFADQDLDINIAGVGSVYYKGGASIKQHIAGSGEVKKLE